MSESSIIWGAGIEPGVRRGTQVRDGFDCIKAPCGKRGCGERPGSSHGRHGDEWVYSVTDGEFALTLVVFTNLLRGVEFDGCSAELRNYFPKGAGMYSHSRSPTSEEQIREGFTGEKCEFLDGGVCFSGWSTALGGDEFFKAHGRNALDQSSEFWRMFEEKWREARASLESDRPKVMQCACCKGAGVVSIETPVARP